MDFTAEVLLMAKVRRAAQFGQRLRQLRMERGLSQESLAKRVGMSRRMIAYYEGESGDSPSGSFVTKMAKVLGVSTDRLLGLKSIQTETYPRDVRLVRRLRKIISLPRHHQRAILEHLDALVTKTNGNGQRVAA